MFIESNNMSPDYIILAFSFFIYHNYDLLHFTLTEKNKLLNLLPNGLKSNITI